MSDAEIRPPIPVVLTGGFGSRGVQMSSWLLDYSIVPPPWDVTDHRGKGGSMGRKSSGWNGLSFEFRFYSFS